ncbi:hypothetical protein [Vibrio algivorus]|uniref:Uncharacterized protein n=1 Tax=Vibrio algivorus TaxID=1667024 RepID=A0A557P349_9VIBR|nr:hypothetical protein [Vibrio algivorus]TVO35085.1 hypothetical protein FOF44_12340 [Vibrio algivorus]
MITKFKGSRAWNAYMAYVGFIFHLHRAATFRELKFTTVEECQAYFKQADIEAKRQIIIELMTVVRIDTTDMMALLAIHETKHGMSIDASSIDNFELKEIGEMVIESLLRCSSEKDAGLFF